GSGETVTINAGPLSVDNVTLGSNATLAISGGRDHITAQGAGDVIRANNLDPGSVIGAIANSTTILLGSDSSPTLLLNASAIGELITVQASAGHTYTGDISIKNFGINDRLDLQGFGFTGFVIGANSVASHLTPAALSDTLALPGGGKIEF